jgi:hypothetical protein
MDMYDIIPAFLNDLTYSGSRSGEIPGIERIAGPLDIVHMVIGFNTWFTGAQARRQPINAPAQRPKMVGVREQKAGMGLGNGRDG